MKLFISAALLLSGLTFSHTSSATIWSWIDNLYTCNGSANTCYDFTIADWDENDTTPNPCYGLTACTIFISHRHNAAGTSGNEIERSWGAGAYPFLLTVETMGDMGKELKAIFSLPFSSTARHRGSVVTDECVGFFYAPGQNLGSYTSTHYSTSFSGHDLLPGSICGVAPAPNSSCDFNQDVLTLDHGTLSRSELDGHEVTESVSVSCSVEQTLKLYIYSANEVSLRTDGSLYSELYLNDNVLGSTGLTIDVNGQAEVNVKSRLRTNGTPESGEFSGSTIMLITIE